MLRKKQNNLLLLIGTTYIITLFHLI